MLSAADYAFLTDFLRRRSGLSITSEKAYLIESRLKPIASRLGLKSAADLVRRLRRGDEALAGTVSDAMTTNETSFFRDKIPFDRLRDAMLPALLTARRDVSRLRIWSSAASTGQEPYSIAMVLDALPQLAAWTTELLATDINAEIIERAKEGFYSEFEVLRGLPIQMLARHFHQQAGEWRVSSSIRSRVQFQIFNLLDSFKPLGQFDIIFCRNVLIYFDQPTKHDVLGRLVDALAPDGYLVLGSAETVLGSGEGLQPLINARGIYSKRGSVQPPRVAAG